MRSIRGRLGRLESHIRAGRPCACREPIEAKTVSVGPVPGAPLPVLPTAAVHAIWANAEGQLTLQVTDDTWWQVFWGPGGRCPRCGGRRPWVSAVYYEGVKSLEAFAPRQGVDTVLDLRAAAGKGG